VPELKTKHLAERLAERVKKGLWWTREWVTEDDYGLPMRVDEPEVWKVSVGPREPWITLDVMGRCPRHTFVVITWAPLFTEWVGDLEPLGNVYLGWPISCQATFDWGWSHLYDLAAAGWNVVLSAEPLLGPIDIGNAKLAGVLAGSGPGAYAEPVPGLDVPCQLRDQCQRRKIPFFWKSWGAWRPVPPATRQDGDRVLEMSRYPEDHRVACMRPTKGKLYRKLAGVIHNDLAWGGK
jgi:hypothetical protein